MRSVRGVLGGPDQDPDEIIDPSPRPHYPNGLRYKDIYCLGCHRFSDCCICKDRSMRSIAEIFSSHEVLDSDGRHINGTDKNGPNHQYGDVYEKIIDNRFGIGCDSRNQVKLMMEVGVADGSCLLAWSEIFPNARIVGMDIHIADKVVSRRYDNIEFHIGDQCSKEDCERAAGNRQFDMIVEDATHILANSLVTLLYLWPFVKPGGIYVIEEFANVGALRKTIEALWHMQDWGIGGSAVGVEIIDSQGPNGGVEPLVVFRKPK